MAESELLKISSDAIFGLLGVFIGGWIANRQAKRARAIEDTRHALRAYQDLLKVEQDIAHRLRFAADARVHVGGGAVEAIAAARAAAPKLLDAMANVGLADSDAVRRDIAVDLNNTVVGLIDLATGGRWDAFGALWKRAVAARDQLHRECSVLRDELPRLAKAKARKWPTS